jgi:hypothetical protein
MENLCFDFRDRIYKNKEQKNHWRGSFYFLLIPPPGKPVVGIRKK